MIHNNDKPILVSACLLGSCCKYSGGHNRSETVCALAEKHTLIPICPEQEGGLPTPRPPAELRGNRVINFEGQDVTKYYQRGAYAALQTARTCGCNIAVLKARSPSCGCGFVYDGSFSGRLIEGDGITCSLLKKNGIQIYTEERLPKSL